MPIDRIVRAVALLAPLCLLTVSAAVAGKPGPTSGATTTPSKKKQPRGRAKAVGNDRGLKRIRTPGHVFLPCYEFASTSTGAPQPSFRVDEGCNSHPGLHVAPVRIPLTADPTFITSVRCMFNTEGKAEVALVKFSIFDSGPSYPDHIVLPKSAHTVDARRGKAGIDGAKIEKYPDQPYLVDPDGFIEAHVSLPHSKKDKAGGFRGCVVEYMVEHEASG